MKIIAVDYKGKWFVLTDENRRDDIYDYERPEIDVEYVTTHGLRGHVENCRYYGIPPYIGGSVELSTRIEAIHKELDIIDEGVTGETGGKA